MGNGGGVEKEEKVERGGAEGRRGWSGEEGRVRDREWNEVEEGWIEEWSGVKGGRWRKDGGERRMRWRGKEWRGRKMRMERDGQ